ncbi:serine--tRNA ligase [Solirubrobacter sp. CPCC 204708]|uniref:Serine--tRNA ligase n=1 Tax=Solirubrobacter deserti TaxID=2282478 RepID=A0ABT4RER9_9ACTN|nr:serine--tRNA ligase [Solirubrobacter deserti]MBE2318569.1 serine--tRNA ligase [Solirubrobacter deserti]MDA0137027.1 serine--tRNA ligase [Solirubrobacter deserti]
MLDLRAISRDPEPAIAALARRKDGSDDRLRAALAARERLNAIRPELEAAQAERNAGAKAIGDAKRTGADASEAIAAMQAVSARVKELEPEKDRLEEELNQLATSLPNLTDPSAADEDTALREWGERAESGKDHLELAGAMIDMEAGSKTSGSRFAYLKGDLVFLELALVRWTLEKLRGHGFEPVIPPVLVKEDALFGTGFLPDTEQQIYRLADDPLYLSGTSEVALASLHAGQIMDEVPRRYAGFSPCFRREAGAAGKDTRGIFRVHQFDKVEMFSFVEPQDSAAEHDRLLAIEEEIWQGLQIPYRVVNIAVDDLGSSAAKKYDIEAWLPSQQKFREVTSTSNTTDFQARRLDIRYRPGGGKPAHVHTLNGTAVAVSRALIALMENHQTEDGGVEIPQVLQDWGAPARLG